MDREYKKIEVRISKLVLIELPPHALTPYVIDKLRNAGIPVKGILLFNGVANGTLIQIDDLDTNEYVFIWRVEE